MRFNGPAPETINGRLAMIGFVAGAMNEFQTSTPLEEQVNPFRTFGALSVALQVIGRLANRLCCA